ncbi:iron donor protein CyaY [Thorsellia anophelis]|nr:iron donor protein CyaY [Thorsellia anophelis]
MQDFEYHEKVDSLMHQIEDQLDSYTGDADIDYEFQSGILTISFPEGSKIILNKQEPLHQIWMATKFNGHHFGFNEDKQGWYCVRTGEPFLDLLSEAASKQSGDTLRFE